MSIPKLKVYRLEKNYNQSNDTDIQSLNADELYPVHQKPLDPNLARLLVGVDHRDTTVVLKDHVLGEPVWQHVMVGMKPVYGEGGQIEGHSLNTTDEIGCDGWRLDKSSIKLFIKKIPLSPGGSTAGDVWETDHALWSEYKNTDNYRLLFDTRTIAYNDQHEEIEDSEANHALIVGRREKKTLSIEMGALLFLDPTFWILDGLTEYDEFQPIDNVFIGYQLYREVLDNEQVANYGTDSIIPFGAVYNGNREGYANKKDYPGTLTINEGNPSFMRSIYPLRHIVAKSPSSTSTDFHKDVDIQGSGTIEVLNTSNWIQSGDLAPVLVERITVFDDKGVPREIYKELALNKQYNRSPVVSYVDKQNNIRGKYLFNLIAGYYRVSDGMGSSDTRFPEQLFVRYNEVDDNLGHIFDFDYKYNIDNNGVLEENNTIGEYENTGVCIYPSAPDGYIYKKKNILAIQSESMTKTDDDLSMTVDASGQFQTFVLPASFYFDNNHPLEIYDNGLLVYDSVVGDGESYNIHYNSGSRTITISLDMAAGLPEDVMVVYYERRAIGIGKDGAVNHWCMGYRVSCYEKVDLTDTFASPHNNWVSDHLNNNPDVFKGYFVYEGTGTEGVPTSGLTFSYLESGYNIYYRDGYVVLSEKTQRILTKNEAKNFNGLSADDDNPENYRLLTTGVRANYAYYVGLVNLTGVIVRNYTARGGQYAYKFFDHEIYPLSINRKMVLRNDSYMPSFFECGGRNLPDISNFSGVELSMFTATTVTYGQGVRVDTASNRLSSILFNINLSGYKSWIVVYVNINHMGEPVLINDEMQLIDGDIPIYCLYLDNISGGSPYNKGSVYIGSDSVVDQDFTLDGSDLVEMARMPDIYPDGRALSGTDGNDVIDDISQYVYSNPNWTYDVVFELLAYRGDSSVEILVYRRERS